MHIIQPTPIPNIGKKYEKDISIVLCVFKAVFL